MSSINLHTVYLILGLVVGFESNYSSSEVDVQRQVCVTVTNPPLERVLLVSFEILVGTRFRTAGKAVLVAWCTIPSYEHAHCCRGRRF